MKKEEMKKIMNDVVMLKEKARKKAIDKVGEKAYIKDSFLVELENIHNDYFLFKYQIYNEYKVKEKDTIMIFLEDLVE